MESSFCSIVLVVWRSCLWCWRKLKNYRNQRRWNVGICEAVTKLVVTWTFCLLTPCLAVEFSSRIVFAKQTPWQGILGPTNLRAYGFSPGQYHPGVEIFRGIPYASPPIAQHRYESPQTISLLSNQTYIANDTRPPCPREYDALNMYKGPDPLRRIKSNLNQDALEDCLFLDIYAPRVSQKSSGSRLPVLVYANSHGDDPEDPFDGSSLAAIGNIIVVSFRYRVGVLGFLSPTLTNTEDNIRSNNFGLWDQLAALHWVRENIPGFGGDENNVCLMGFDLDASFVGVLALSPLSEAYGGLFHRLILLNGSPLSPVSINQRPLDTTVHMARVLNCPLHERSGELIRCLRQKQLDQLLKAAHSIGSTIFNNHFAPSVDGRMVQETVGNANSYHANLDSLKETLGRYEILCGLSEGDVLPNIGRPALWHNLDLDSFVVAVLKLALNLEPGTEPGQALQEDLKRALVNEYGEPPFLVRDILADFLMVFPMIKLLNLHSQTGKNTYFYVSKNFDPLGKAKKNDLSYIFSDSVYKWKYIDYGQPNADLQPFELLITFIANFVRSGDPNVQNPKERFSIARNSAWPKYRVEKGSYLRFGRNVVVESKFRQRSMDFWSHVFPTIIKTALSSEQLNEWEPNSDTRFPVHFGEPGGGIGFPPRVIDSGHPIGQEKGDGEVLSGMTQNTVVMIGGFLLLLNLLCFMGLFYQRQRLKRAELRLRRRCNQAIQNVPSTEGTRGMTSGDGHRIPSDISETYGYVGLPVSQPQLRAPLDTLSETETDNGFGSDFLGPNYDPRTKVTRWMFQQNRNGSFEQEQIPMTSLIPYNNGPLSRPSAPTPHSHNLGVGGSFYPFQPSTPISDIPYADSRATSPSVTNYSAKVQTTPSPAFNNNLTTNNFNNPRLRFLPSPSSSGTTTLSNPESHNRRTNRVFFPFRNSVVVQEVDLEEYPSGDTGGVLVVRDNIEVESSKPKLVPVKTGTLTRSVGVGENDGDESLPLLHTPPLVHRTNPSPSGSNRQGQKVTFAEGI